MYNFEDYNAPIWAIDDQWENCWIFTSSSSWLRSCARKSSLVLALQWPARRKTRVIVSALFIQLRLYLSWSCLWIENLTRVTLRWESLKLKSTRYTWSFSLNDPCPFGQGVSRSKGSIISDGWRAWVGQAALTLQTY